MYLHFIGLTISIPNSAIFEWVKCIFFLLGISLCSVHKAYVKGTKVAYLILKGIFMQV
jgi:hypothetical protein